MQSIEFHKIFIKQLTAEEYSSLFVFMRIFSELNRKIKIHINAIEEKIYINSEVIDSYCDLFSTYNEGAKEYFNNHVDNIHSIANIKLSDYTNKMIKIYKGKPTESPEPYKILKKIRDVAGFHFRKDFINKFNVKDKEKRIALIGFIDENNNVRFSNYVPYIIEYIGNEFDLDLDLDSISTFFRNIFQEEITVFRKYFEELMDHILSENNVTVS